VPRTGAGARPDEEVPDVGGGVVEVLAQHRDERVHLERRVRRHDVLEQAVEQLRPVLHPLVDVGAQPAEPLEDLVEMREQARARHLGHVVQRLA
jgi:hypothetical protein